MSTVVQNTAANAIGLLYTTVVTLSVLPLYLEYLGSDSFGLIAVFLMIQAWVQIFDLGISPLFSREVAKSRANNLQEPAYIVRLLRSLEIVLISICIALFMVFIVIRKWISENWLEIGSLSIDTVLTCLTLMCATACMRLVSSLHKSGLAGMEYQVRLNVVIVLFVTLKYIGAWFLMAFLSRNIVHFFVYQLLVGFIEVLTLAILCHSAIPSAVFNRLSIHWSALRAVMPFASGLAYLALLWILLSQTDKLVMSSILPLSEFGYFTLLTLLAAGISQLAAPVRQAILPRMTFLLSQGKQLKMHTLYRNATQLTAIVIVPLSAIVAIFAEEIIFVWTGDPIAARWAGPVLFWFALGNGLMALTAFQYFLQFAHGRLRMHIIFSSVMACLQIPVLVYAAYVHGVLVVSIIWFALRLITFLVWTAIVHQVFAPGIHWRWLVFDIAPSVTITLLLIQLLSVFDISLLVFNRAEIFSLLLMFALVIVSGCALASPVVGKYIRMRFAKQVNAHDV